MGRNTSVRPIKKSGGSQIASKDTEKEIRLRLEGANATRGITWSALEGFLEHFSRALVATHRDVRGAELVRSGSPDKLDAAATALRIVRLEPGSAVLDVEPIPVADDGGLAEDVPTLAESALERLMGAVGGGETLPLPIVESLEAARSQCGADGRFTVSAKDGEHQTVFDRSSIQALWPSETTGHAEDATVDSLVGRLIRLSETPEQVLIREQDGIEWICHFDQSVAEQLGPLWRQTVLVEGSGDVGSGHKPRFQIERIRRAVPSEEQTELFTVSQVPTADVVSRYGIVSAQDPDDLSPDDSVDEESEDRFLNTILG